MPQLAARPVDIFRIEVVSYQYPELVLEVECGSGTYIRSLGRDLAESLGTAAVMSALERIAIGRFRKEDALKPHDLKRDNWQRFLLPPLAAVEDLPRVQLSAAEVTRIQNGLTVERKSLAVLHEESPAEIVAVDPTGELVGILTQDANNQWRVLRNMPTA